MPQSPTHVFVWSFVLAAAAGLASLLRSPVSLTTRVVASAVLNSGLVGLAISLVWYSRFGDEIYSLVGVCVLAGLAGMVTVNMVAAAFRNGGLSIRMTKDGFRFGPHGDEKGDDA